ncbi:cytochrome P450 [Nemania abortiva]|nr:cytochrome P450 [Nemania abortiva]
MSFLEAGLVLVIVVGFWYLSNVGRRPRHYPPGPPTLPVIGNLHQIPREKRHARFAQWAREYGPIYSLILGTKVMIVLNSDLAVRELADKRGGIYSSRPDGYIAQDILSGGLRVLLMVCVLNPASFVEHLYSKQIEDTGLIRPTQPNHGAWSIARKLGHRILNTTIARSYVPYQDLESKAMLLGFLENPNDFIDHLRRYTASLMTQMAFGFRTASIQDLRFKEAFDIFDRSSEIIGSKTAALLDLIPILRYIPDFVLTLRREARKLHQRERKLFRTLFSNAKEGLKNGTAQPCFCVDLIKIQAEETVSDDLAAYLSGSLLQAGSETTSNILVAFVQAMVLFPDVAKAAQSELDRVCGGRMPDLNDVPDLPYIRACAKEILRWMPGFMLGIPHAVTQDDSYMGYHIPKGATVILNAWAIHNDPKRHPDPRRFYPERYLNDRQTSVESASNPDVTKRDHFAFGAGRRRCQGIHIADRSIFLAISRLLWAFDFGKAIDQETGQEIAPDMDDFVEGVMQFPKPFRASIRARDAEKAETVRQEWADMSTLLDEQKQWRVVPEGLIWKDEQAFEND